GCGRVGRLWVLLSGMVISATTPLAFTNLTENTSLFYLTVAFAVRMLGIAMVMMPSTTAGLNILPIHLISHGTAMINTMRQVAASRSEEHTSELQSRFDFVCRLVLEQKKQ